jgi:hypothetical protein
MPTADPRTVLLVAKRVAKCQTLRNGTIATVGDVLIDKLSIHVRDDDADVQVSGDDLVGELSNRIVGQLVLSAGSGDTPTPTATGLAAIIALAPPGWTLDTTTYQSTGNINGTTTVSAVTHVENFVIGKPIIGTGIPANTVVTATDPVLHTVTISNAATTTATGVTFQASSLYLKFNNERVLEALVKVAEAVGEHVRFDTTTKTATWLYRQQPSSGIRAVRAGGTVLASTPNVCAITDLEEVADTSATMTRIYPTGGGNEAARVTLAKTKRFGAPGSGTGAHDYVSGDYTLHIDFDHPEQCYIAHTASDAANRIDGVQPFKDIAELGSGGNHGQSAADMLFDVALVYLQQHLTSVPQKSYRLSIVGLDQDLLPGQTIQVVYRDIVHLITIDAALVVLETTTAIDDAGIRTVAMQVATVDRWPQDDTERTLSALSKASSYDNHLQKAAQAATADVAGTATNAATLDTYAPLFVKTSDTTVANTVTETSIVGTGAGATTLTFVAGRAVRLTAYGYLSDTGTPTLTIRVKYGGTLLVSCAPVLATGLANAGWQLLVTLTCRTDGSSGTLIAEGTLIVGGTVTHLVAVATVTKDVTVANGVGLTAQWGAASASNTLTCAALLLEQIN